MKNNFIRLKKEINQQKKVLYELLDQFSTGNQEVMTVNCELDRLIVDYMRQQNNKKGWI